MIAAISCFLRELEVKKAARLMSLRDLFDLFGLSAKRVLHRTCKVVPPEGLVLKQMLYHSPILSVFRVFDTMRRSG